MAEQRRAESTGQCSDTACRYRQLYEGSQTSLADMATKQAAALRSVVAMKRRIADLIKQHFPDNFNRTERHLGHRFSDASDDVVLTYLEQLVSEAISPLAVTTPPPAAGADLLRAALRRAGYPVGDDTDLSAWAAIVERTAPPRPATPPNPAPSAPSVAPAVPGAVSHDTGPSEDELDDLFGDDEPLPTDEGDLGSGFEDLFSDDPAPTHPASNTARHDTPSAAPADEPLDFDDLFGDDEPASPTPHTPPAPAAAPAGDDSALDLDDLFGETSSSSPAPHPTPAHNDAGDGLDDLFGDDEPPAPPAGGAEEALGDLFDDLFDEPVATPSPTATAPTSAAADGLDDLFGDDETTPSTGVSGAAPEADDGWNAPPDAEALTVPIRPELVPGRTRKRKPRTPRTRASRPDPSRDLDQDETAPDVEPDVASRIAAAVAIPRPMFNSDLESVAGDREILDAWSQEMLNLGAVAPVRFVVAKARHRALGPLVLPHGDLRAAATEFDNSWWAQVMDKYHGTALYELAVLLSRVGDQVQATDLWDTAARFRLDTPRGLVGLVVHLSGGLNDGDLGRTELDEALAGFSRERFTLVAVLNVVANPAALDALAECVTELADAHSWKPAYPVVATHTWEWAANSGRTARLVLGG